MARSGRSSQKSGARRVTLGILIFGALALIVAQSAPQIASFFVPARTTISDRIGAPSDTSIWAQVSGQADRERRIRELENEVRDLARYKAAAISMAERMEAYETILNLMGEPPERGVTARITTVIDGPFAQTVLANAGSLQGVAPGAVAMNEGGLVGRVIQLGDRSSRILLVSNYQSQLPVLGEVSGVRAILQGKDRDRGVLKDLPEAADFIEGERVLSSGEGGAFPRGLVAGTATKQGGDWIVRLAMRDHSSGYVRMIAPPEIVEPVPESDLPPEPVVAEETPTPPVATARPVPQPARPAASDPPVVAAASEPPAPQVTTQSSEADPNTVGLPAVPPQEGE
ncbi:MAG: rod shape-determining protein MreC [Hyphomonas sp.]|uniref:rod shape-determining protein MreC n=1 Tax=Hyphomonas sp. TaxID=87 RepID=UPI0034A064FD